MKSCPDCGAVATRRVARAWWQRMLFPESVRIRCNKCGERSLFRGASASSKV